MTTKIDALCDELVDLANENKLEVAVKRVKALGPRAKIALENTLRQRLKQLDRGPTSLRNGETLLVRIFGGGEPHQY